MNAVIDDSEELFNEHLDRASTATLGRVRRIEGERRRRISPRDMEWVWQRFSEIKRIGLAVIAERRARLGLEERIA